MNLNQVRQQLNLGVPLTKMKLRVTDYSRVSTDHKTQLTSLKNQIDYFDKMINDNPNWIYVKGYVDEGITGTSDVKRENFMRMIEDAKKGYFDLIITKEISRFSRNTLDSIKYTRELLSYGVAVLFINDNINTALPDSELRLTIMASLAQDEIRRLSERVKFGMNESINKGNILGHNKLYGYKKDKNTNKLVIIKEEQEVVKRLFSMYAIHNLSLNEISRIFNNENIKTNRNKKWTPTTLSRMIQNIKYKGYYCGRKTEVVDYITKKINYLPKSDWIIYKDTKKIPPIIDENLWDKANNRLNSKSKKQRQSQKKYPYSSKIYCQTHNSTFHRRKQCKKTNDNTWLCSKYLKKGKEFCDSPNIREKELDYILKDIFYNLNLDLSKVKTLLLNNYQKDSSENTKSKIISIQKEIDFLNKKKEKLLELVINKNISDKEFTDRNNNLNNEIKYLTEKIQILTKNKKVKKDDKKLECIINQKLSSNSIFNKLLSLLLEKIVVSKDNKIIKLEVYIKYKILSPTKILSYSFKRGYNTKSTKRYTINYQVHLPIN